MRLWRHLALKLRKYNETKQTGYAGDLKRKWAEWKEKNKLIIKKGEGQKHKLEIIKQSVFSKGKVH